MNHSILILAELGRGTVAEISYEVVNAGRQLADALQVPLHVALFGNQAGDFAGQFPSADRVFVLEDPHLDVLAPGVAASALKHLMDQQQASLVLLGATNLALGIGAILAARTHLPYVNFCHALRVEEGEVILTSHLLGGKILADVRLPGNRGIISIYPGSFPALCADGGRTPAVERLEPVSTAPAVAFERFIEPPTGDVDITKQDVLVAVGRGLQNQDNLSLAEELAQALGGAVCASRPVIDQNWLPLTRQVGKSGMTVKPRLYVVLGISGAPEHVEGMQNSQLIIAINSDPKAPIFGCAHYGVCGDLLEIVPALVGKIKACRDSVHCEH